MFNKQDSFLMVKGNKSSTSTKAKAKKTQVKLWSSCSPLILDSKLPPSLSQSYESLGKFIALCMSWEAFKRGFLWLPKKCFVEMDEFKGIEPSDKNHQLFSFPSEYLKIDNEKPKSNSCLLMNSSIPKKYTGNIETINLSNILSQSIKNNKSNNKSIVSRGNLINYESFSTVSNPFSVKDNFHLINPKVENNNNFIDLYDCNNGSVTFNDCSITCNDISLSCNGNTIFNNLSITCKNISLSGSDSIKARNIDINCQGPIYGKGHINVSGKVSIKSGNFNFYSPGLNSETTLDIVGYFPYLELRNSLISGAEKLLAVDLAVDKESRPIAGKNSKFIDDLADEILEFAGNLRFPDNKNVKYLQY